MSGAVTPTLIKLVLTRLRLGFRAQPLYTAWQQESRLTLLTLQHTEDLEDARLDCILHYNTGNK